MNKHEKYSKRKYDSIAKTYDISWDGKMAGKHKQKLIELAEVKDNYTILDVGCGNGTLINALKHKANNVNAYGIDLSPNMIEECKKRYSDISFTVSSGENLAFDDNSIDLVSICFVLHHLHNPQNFFKETHRILKQGGILIVNEIKLPIVIRKLFDWIFSPLYRAGDNKLFGHKRLKKLFNDNGFEIVITYKKGVKQIVAGKKK